MNGFIEACTLTMLGRFPHGHLILRILQGNHRGIHCIHDHCGLQDVSKTSQHDVIVLVQVWALLGEHDKAIEGLQHVKEIDGAAAAEADREIARLNQRHKAASQKQKQTFRNFFDR